MAKSLGSGERSHRPYAVTGPTSGSCTPSTYASTPLDSSGTLEGLQQSCSHTFLYLSDTAKPLMFTHFIGFDGVVHSSVKAKAT